MSSPYSLLLVAGLAVSFLTWQRLARRDERLVLIYLAGLVCAFLGAKLVYLAAEGWLFWSHPQRWIIWATGKTILGALLGGYAGVEGAKRLTRYTAATGDHFALVAPLGILFGRLGCLLHGCCLGAQCAPAWWSLRDAAGTPRWPAVPVEMVFNGIALLGAWAAVQRGWQRGQLFHLYLIAYGAFRFAHEWARSTPRFSWGLGGYHFAALAVLFLGLAGFIHRRRSPAPVS